MLSRDGPRERTYLGDIISLSRAELGPIMPTVRTWVVRMVAGVVLGSGRVPGECWPPFDVLADVESGAWVGIGPIPQHHYEVFALLFGCVYSGRRRRRLCDQSNRLNNVVDR